MSKQYIGKIGEECAKSFLINQGLVILEQNYRYGRYEIDIVAQRNDLIIFVEVKSRTSLRYGEPVIAVDGIKINKMKIVAENYLYQNNIHHSHIRFDCIAILFNKNNLKDYNIQHIQDLF